MVNELQEEDCYGCGWFFPAYNCHAPARKGRGRLPFVAIPSGIFGGKKLKQIRCKQHGTVKCTEFVPYFKDTLF